MSRAPRIGLKLVVVGLLILILLIFGQGSVDFVYTGF